MTVHPIIESTPSGKNVYIYFIDCIPPIWNTNLEQLKINQSFIDDKHFKEKTKLQWFSVYEIYNKKDILYRLKQTILKHF